MEYNNFLWRNICFLEQFSLSNEWHHLVARSCPWKALHVHYWLEHNSVNCVSVNNTLYTLPSEIRYAFLPSLSAHTPTCRDQQCWLFSRPETSVDITGLGLAEVGCPALPMKSTETISNECWWQTSEEGQTNLGWVKAKLISSERWVRERAINDSLKPYWPRSSEQNSIWGKQVSLPESCWNKVPLKRRSGVSFLHRWKNCWCTSP